jgi:hypothetical protein
MHGRTARASIDARAQRATTHSSSTRPGCRAFGRSRRYGPSRAVRVRVAPGGVPSGRNKRRLQRRASVPHGQAAGRGML